MLVDDGRSEEALRCPFWLGFGLMQRGALAQAGGRIHTDVDLIVATAVA
ncbi:hypothetical protein BH24ACT5_BH24ACT5_21390 [soil metagenome]